MFEKCAKTSFFTVFGGLRRPRQGARGVSYACRADRLNRHFVGVGHVLRAKAEHVLQDDLTEALKRTQHRSQIWPT